MYGHLPVSLQTSTSAIVVHVSMMEPVVMTSTAIHAPVPQDILELIAKRVRTYKKSFKSNQHGKPMTATVEVTT